MRLSWVQAFRRTLPQPWGRSVQLIEIAMAIPTAEFLALGVEVMGWSTETPEAMKKMAADLELMADVLRRTQLEELLNEGN